jgi:hypothetical protein
MRANLGFISKKLYITTRRREDFLHAFRLLGGGFPSPVRLVIAGGSAMILAGYVDRDTGDGDGDGDVIETSPKLSELRRYIEEVAEALGVKADWLNDGVRAWRDLLPSDFHLRLEPVGTFGNLTVERLGRQDLILMKIAAARPRDLDDLQVLKPTADEIAFVKDQLDRIAAVDMKSAMRIDLYLQQGKKE